MADRTLEFLLTYGKVAGVFVVGVIAIGIIMSILRSALKKSPLDPLLHKLVCSIVKVVLVFILIIVTLEGLGIKTTSFIAVLGVAGAAIALALKDSLSNIAGGVLIVLTRPFDQGDLVEIGSTKGIVLHIDLLMTTLTTEDGNDTVTMPNGLVSTSVMTNYTRKQQLEDVELPKPTER